MRVTATTPETRAAERAWQLYLLRRDLEAKSRGDTFPQPAPPAVLPSYGLHDNGMDAARARAADEALRLHGIKP